MSKNTSYAQFGQILNKLWPFGNSNFSEVPNLWIQFRLTRPKLHISKSWNSLIIMNMVFTKEIATRDPNVHNLESITRFLTLPTVVPRAKSTRRDPIIDFTKPMMLTSKEYANATLEVKCTRLIVAIEKKKSRID